jgi:hypothetical protein
VRTFAVGALLALVGVVKEGLARSPPRGDDDLALAVQPNEHARHPEQQRRPQHLDVVKYFRSILYACMLRWAVCAHRDAGEDVCGVCVCCMWCVCVVYVCGVRVCVSCVVGVSCVCGVSAGRRRGEE